MAARTVKQIAPVTIVGKGSVKATGAPVYAATSTSEVGKLHLITWTPAQEWACDCAAYAFRRRCSHIRALSARLADELRLRAAEVAAAAIGPDDRFALTLKGAAALAEWRKRKEQEAAREVAPRRTGAAFSILK